MDFSNRVLTTVQDKFIPSIVDSINGSNIISLRVMSKPKPWNGPTIKQNIMVSNSTTGGSFDGLDPFDTGVTNTRKQLSWPPKGFYQSIVVPGIEEAVNETDMQVLSLVAAQMDEAKISAQDQIGTMFYAAGVGKDFDGLTLIADDGTSTSSYGGLTRASTPQINGVVRAASGGTLTLDLMAATYDATMAAGVMSETPNLFLTDKTTWSLYESLLTPTVRSTYATDGYPVVTADTAPGTATRGNAFRGNQGFEAVLFRGKPLVADDKAPIGSLFYLNENYLQYYSLKSKRLNTVTMNVEVTEGVYKDKPVATAFQMKDLMMPTNQFASIGQLIALGNLICRQPRRVGKITGITNA